MPYDDDRELTEEVYYEDKDYEDVSDVPTEPDEDGSVHDILIEVRTMLRAWQPVIQRAAETQAAVDGAKHMALSALKELLQEGRNLCRHNLVRAAIASGGFVLVISVSTSIAGIEMVMLLLDQLPFFSVPDEGQ